MSSRSLYITQTIFHRLFRCVLLLLLRAEVVGNINVFTKNQGTPLIIAANHRSRIDPFLLALLPRKQLDLILPISFPTTEVYYRRLLFRIWIAPLGAYSIPQYATTVDEYLNETIKKLKAGNTVMLFPEARLVTHGGMGTAKAGIIIAAQRSGARIIPIQIEGSQLVSFWNILTRQVGVRIIVGELFDLDKNITEENMPACRAESARLLNVIYTLTNNNATRAR